MNLLPALVIFSAIFCLSQAVRLPDPSWAAEVKTPPKDKGKKSLGADPAPVDCNNRFFMCADCNTNRVCKPTTNGIAHYKDTACPADRPFCDSASGSCVTTPPLECGQKDTFTCLGKDQFYPDADCTKYHYCNSSYGSQLFTCVAAGTTYDAEQKRCVPGGDCGKFDCNTKNSLKKTSHSNFPRYYAMCKSETDNTDGPLVVGVCPPYYRIDPKSQTCEADCDTHGNGNIPVFDDCTKYWTCALNRLEDGRLYMFKKLKTCPSKNYFDANLFMCLPDPDGKKCSKN